MLLPLNIHYNHLKCERLTHDDITREAEPQNEKVGAKWEKQTDNKVRTQKTSMNMDYDNLLDL